jgi:hypothetical protein
MLSANKCCRKTYVFITLEGSVNTYFYAVIYSMKKLLRKSKIMLLIEIAIYLVIAISAALLIVII